MNKEENMMNEGRKWRTDGLTRAGAEGLLAEEQRVEGDGFGERHADDGLNEDLAGSAGIASDALDGLGADETDTDGGGEAAEGALNAAGDFSDDWDHVDCILFGCVAAVRTLGTLPAVNASEQVPFHAHVLCHDDHRRDCRSGRCIR